nr:diphosphoinositol polyphosphate phosphohydrolase 3-beta-like [Aotus nancymaae]
MEPAPFLLNKTDGCINKTLNSIQSLALWLKKPNPQQRAAALRIKCKPNQTRTYDPEGFKKRAACLCFRSEREDEVLLVSSSRYPDRWIVPGAGMEPEEEPGRAAVREVYEEAGVKGKLGRLPGVFEQNQDRKHRTYVYVLTVTELLEDWEDSVNIGRKREWFKVEDAIKVLQYQVVHSTLKNLRLHSMPVSSYVTFQQYSRPLQTSPGSAAKTFMRCFFSEEIASSNGHPFPPLSHHSDLLLGSLLRTRKLPPFSFRE